MYFHRAPGLIGGMADVFQKAIHALRFARNAELASMPDNLMGEENPLLARDDAHQVLLDFLWIIVRGEFETARDAVYMSVDNYAFSDFEPRSQHNVGGLARDSGQREQILHVQRNLPAKVGNHFFCRADN